MKALIASSLVGFLALMVACASYDTKHVDVTDIDGYPNHAFKDDIGLAADVYDTSDRVKTAFSDNLVGGGYLPVNIVISNASDERILIFKETIELVDGTGIPHRPVSARVIAEDFEHNKMAYALLGFGIFSYMSADEANKDREADLADKELPDNIIVRPGRSHSGFVYFKFRKGENSGTSSLRLVVEKMESDEDVDFELTLFTDTPGRQAGQQGLTTSSQAGAKEATGDASRGNVDSELETKSTNPRADDCGYVFSTCTIAPTHF